MLKESTDAYSLPWVGFRVTPWLSPVGMYHDSGVNTGLMQLHIVYKFHVYFFFWRVGLRDIGGVCSALSGVGTFIRL